MNTDVLIVGAGPTGLALACQLIRYDVDFIIIDKKETTTPYSKAIGVQARTLEIYDQIGLADKLCSLGMVANGAKLFAGGKLRGEIDFTDIGKGMTPFPGVLIVEQGKHEKLLYEYITSHGHDVNWSSELAEFTQNDTGVKAKIIDADGARETVQAKFMVGCDGAKSLVRHDLGLRFEGSTFERMFYVADVDIDWQYGSGGLFAFLMQSNLLVVFTMDGKRRYRIVGTFPREFAKEEGDVLYEEIEAQIRADAEIEFDITKVHWFSTYKVHTRHVDKFSVGRCFLAGDAAHIHSPAGAQGMNTGIQDGYNLAWKLASVLKGQAGLPLLDTYNEERLPNAETLTRTTDRFFGLIADPNPFASFFRIFVFPFVAKLISRLNAVRRFVFPRISQIAINYRQSSLSRNKGKFKVRAGDRVPYFHLEGKSIYDGMREPKFHLLAFGREELPEIDAEMKDLLEVQNLPFSRQVMDIFGCDDPFILVVRPDNHIGLISNKFSVDAVNEYMRNATLNSVELSRNSC